MDVMKLRREIILHSNSALKYWWTGDDDPVNGKWIDRINGWEFTLYGTNVYDSENKIYDFGEPTQYAIATPPNQGFSMGHHWQFDFDIQINRDKSTSLFFFDVGSVNESNKGVGFGAGGKAGGNTVNTIINLKTQGNNSIFLNNNEAHPALPLDPADEFVHATGSYKMIDGGDGYDRFVATINGQTIKSKVQVPKIEYAPTWHRNTLSMGMTAYMSQNSYKSSVKVKYIKIYVFD